VYNAKPIKNTNILIIDGDRGKNYPQQSDFYDQEFCLFLNAKNVTISGFNFENTMFITEEKDSMLKNGKLLRNDIILTTRGTVGNTALYNALIPFNNIRINSGMVILRVNPNEYCSEYLYYQIQSSFVKNQIEQIKTGSAQPQLPIKLLNEIELILPHVEIQKSIAKKIRSLVSKIINNDEQVTLLKKTVQLIYKNWFGNFNYTNTAGKSENDIPKGWQRSTVFDNIAEVKNKNNENSDYPVLSVVKEGEFKLSDDVFTKQVYSQSTTNYKVVRRNQVAYNPARANIGSIAMLTDFEVGLVSPIYIVFEMKESITPTFFYYYMKQPMFLENIKHHAIGTTRQNFPFEAFKMFDMVVPPIELQLRFEEIAKLIEQKIALLKEENAILAEIRDTLLPKLMSGELPVREE